MSMGGATLSPVVGGNVMTSGASVGVRVNAGTKVTFGRGVSSVLRACCAVRAVIVPLTANCTSLIPVVVSEGTGVKACVAVGAGVPEQAVIRAKSKKVLSAEY